MTNTLRESDIYGIINRKVNFHGSAAAFAKSAGVTNAYLSAVRNASKPIPRNDSPLTYALGVEWVPPTGGYWRFREDV